VGDRSAFVRVFGRSDGLRDVEVSSVPVNFLRAPGDWEPIDTSVVADGTAGVLRSSANAWTARFAPFDKTSGVSVETDSGTLGMVPVGAAHVAPAKVDGDSSAVRYVGVWPSTDLEYHVVASGVKEDIVVGSAKSPGRFDYTLSGATAALSDAGGLVVKGSAGVFTAPALSVVDAKGRDVTKASGARFDVAAGGAGVSVVVDPGWLAGLGVDAFPVRVDPGLFGATLSSPSTMTSYVKYASNGTYNSVSGALWLGRDGSGNLWRAQLGYDYSQFIGDRDRVVAADLQLAPVGGNSSGNSMTVTAATTADWAGSAGSSFGYATVNEGGSGLLEAGFFEPGQLSHALQHWFDAQAGGQLFGLVGKESSNGTEQSYTPTLRLTLAAPAPNTSLSVPAVSGSIVATRTPQLTATAIANDTPVAQGGQGDARYRFEISTSPGPGNGSVASSDWQAGTSWTPRDHTLRDGVTYYARVYANYQNLVDVYGTDPQLPNASDDRQFRVALNMGGGGPAPTETAGSVPGVTASPSEGAPSPSTPGAAATVNLVNGNLAVSVGTHQVQGVAGAVAPALVFNSQGDTSAGLSAVFATDGDNVTRGQRVDPSVNFAWSSAPPVAGMPAGASYHVTWTGTVRLSGSWTFGVAESGAGGARVTLNNQVVADEWAAPSSIPVTKFAAAAYNFGSSPSVVPIKVEYHTGPLGGSVQLLAQDSTGAVHLADPSWFTQTVPVLPDHWQLSAGAAAASWAGVSDLGDQVAIRATDGSSVAFTRTSTGGFVAPPGDSDLLTQDSTGMFQLNSAGGLLYTFRADGQLESVVSAADDLHPGAYCDHYNNNLQLDTIADRVTATGSDCFASNPHQVVFHYGSGSGTPACPTPSGSGSVPAGMLAQIDFWDTLPSSSSLVSTYLFYDSSGRLARVATPGFMVGSQTGCTITDFGYDASGLLTSFRDPLAADWIAYGQATGAWQKTDLSYDSTGRLTQIIKPVLGGGESRAQANYCYDTSPVRTRVKLSGFTASPTNCAETSAARTVTYDQGRITTDTDAVGHTTSYTWDPQGRVVATQDPAGMETTSAYDFSGNKTDAWGPALASYFDATTHQPLSQYAAVVPHATTAYDEPANIGTGLGATWWANSNLAGAPKAHSLGIGTGGIVADPGWGTSVPSQLSGSGAQTGNWGLRLTGIITFPQSGNYRLDALSAGGVRVYLDDQLIIDNWTDTGGPANDNYYPAINQNPQHFDAGPHRIRIDYHETYDAAALQLLWQTPTSGVNYPNVPGYSPSGGGLSPAYNLPTTSIDADSKTTTTSYNDGGHIGPQYGLVTATTQDPAGANLTTSVTYEDPTTSGTYLRAIAKTLPAGNTTTSCYWGTSCAGASGSTSSDFSNPCGQTGVNQGGQLKQRTGPDPGDGHHQVEQYVYDPAGRLAGVRKGTDGTGGTISTASWACTYYDTRGRLTSQTWPKTGGGTRTISYSYAEGNYPTTTKVTDSDVSDGWVRVYWDLTGRPLEYETPLNDAWNTYDQLGRLTARSYSASGESSWYQYNPTSGQLQTVGYNDGDYDHTLATASYDSVGRLSGVAYANNTNLALTYNPYYGYLQQESFTAPSNTVLYSETDTRSFADRLVDQAINTGAGPADPNPSGPNFVYDGAGRLTSSYNADGTQEQDSYTTATCGATDAGKNTNRTSINRNGTTQTLCYDTADRLTSTTGTSTNVTYDTHGNTHTIAGDTYTYDDTDRLTSIHNGSTTDAYTRDALGRLTKDDDNGTTATKYAYTDFGDSPTMTFQKSGTSYPLTEYDVGLPGGVTWRRGWTTTSQLTYPNLHGDTVALANAGNGARIGTDNTYTAWGEGTTPDTTPGNQDLGYLATKGKLTNHTTNITPTIDMGARPYRPDLGRFLTTDPIQGGCANNYVYVRGDPANVSDESGRGDVCLAPNAVKQECGTEYLVVPYCQILIGPQKVADIGRFLESPEGTLLGSAAGAAVCAALGVTTGFAGVACAVAFTAGGLDLGEILQRAARDNKGLEITITPLGVTVDLLSPDPKGHCG
jgi:RHS repeat-associated protein